MQVFLSQVVRDLGPRLPNYYGGHNPIIAYLLSTLAVAVLSAIIGYLLWMRWRDLKFDKLCSSWGLDAGEIGYLRRFIKRFHIRDALSVLETRTAFEKFVNQLAHHFEHEIAAEEELARQCQYFQALRSKIPLRSLQAGKLSTRNIHEGTTLTISFQDPATRNSFSFDTPVLSNSDFFIGVLPPESTEIRAACDFSKPMLQIKYCLDDSQFQFETRLARTVNQPDLMWLIRHSNDLTQHTLSESVDINGTILLLDDSSEQSQEWACVVDQLGVDTCRFQVPGRSTPLPTDKMLVVDLPLAGELYSLRGHITSYQGDWAILQFTGLQDADRLQILRHLRNPQPTAGASL